MSSTQSLPEDSSNRTSQDDPFAAIREAADADDQPARGLLIIVSALRETIMECKSKGDSSEPSATEYLASIIPALEGTDQSRTPQLLALLVTVMPHTNRSLLRLKFPSIAAIFIRILRALTDTDHDDTTTTATSLQYLLRCMGFLLAAQERSPALWSSPGVLRLYHALLQSVADRRVKVRRASHQAVVMVLSTLGNSTTPTASKNASRKPGPATQTTEFCQAVMASCTSQDIARALYLLRFMRVAVPLLPSTQASGLCEEALRLTSLGSQPLTAAVMQMLSAVVQSPHPCLTAPFLSKLTRELLALQPSRSAGAGAVSFSSLLASCMVRLQVKRARVVSI